MEIETEITKTKNKIDLLEHQNEKFKALLNKALTVTLTGLENPFFETQFLQESIELIEEEKGRLKDELNTIYIGEESGVQTLLEKIIHLEKRYKTQQEEIQRLKGENSEIKFLLLHPEARNEEWLKTVLKLENEVSNPSETSLVEERFRLQRKILNLEKNKTDLLAVFNDAVLPTSVDSSIENDSGKFVIQKISNVDLLAEYENLRFTMLNLEDDRSRLLNELQCVLDKSRREIAEEYKNLQEKILTVERQKNIIILGPSDLSTQEVTQSELENIFNAFRNLPSGELEEQAREMQRKPELGAMFCPGFGLPMYCNIL